MTLRAYQHLFPIVDQILDDAVDTVEKRGDSIKCQKGCDHCCHLLIEISWEEAYELAKWLVDRPEDQRRRILGRVKQNAESARQFFLTTKGGKKFALPAIGEVDLPDNVYDDYFYGGNPRPCPMLEDGVCSAYEARPTPCRLHMVSSNPDLCAADCHDDDGYEVPDEVEQAKEDLGSVIGALERDGRWGHFAIVLHSLIEELSQKGDLPEFMGRELAEA